MTAIAQAYFHFSPFDSDLDIDSLGEAATSLARAEAADIYGFPCEATIELEEGSLKGWITIVGLVASIFNLSAATLVTINNYPTFKSNLALMMGDARKFASGFNDKFVAQAGVSNDEVFRTERRTKTIGKLWRAIHELEFIVENGNQLPQKELQVRAGRVRKLLDDVAADVSSEDMALIDKILRKQFPKTVPDLMPRVAIRQRHLAPDLRSYRDADDIAGQTLSHRLAENQEMVQIFDLPSGHRQTFTRTVKVLPP